MNKKQKEFRKKYAIVPLNPLMPKGYNSKERKKLREWEQNVLQSKTNKKEKDIEK